MSRQRILAVGLDRATERAGVALAERAGCGFRWFLTAHDALRHLAVDPVEGCTVLISSDLLDLQPTVFVSAARDLLGPEAKLVVTGVDPFSVEAVALLSVGASTCLTDAAQADHPSAALGLAA